MGAHRPPQNPGEGRAAPRSPPGTRREPPPSPSGASGSSPPAGARVPDFTRLSNGIPEISSQLSPDAPAVKNQPQLPEAAGSFSVSQALLKARSRKAPGRAAAAPSCSRGAREACRALGSTHGAAPAHSTALNKEKITRGHTACSRRGLVSGLTPARGGLVPAEQPKGDPGVTCSRGTPRSTAKSRASRGSGRSPHGVNRGFVSRDCTTPGKGKEAASSE